jgi:hypothetical protein
MGCHLLALIPGERAAQLFGQRRDVSGKGVGDHVGMRFTFVADLATAVDQARAATRGEVVIMGGDVIGQALE